MRSLVATIVITTLVLALDASPARAAGAAAAKCEAAKLKLAGKYFSCVLNVLSKNAKKGPAPDLTKCDLKFVGKHAAIEQKAGLGVCPVEGDALATLTTLMDVAWNTVRNIGAHLAGYRGKLDLNTFPAGGWKDSDGVVPTQAGCHTPYPDQACLMVPIGVQDFGEYCENGDNTDILVETNPGLGVCHDHPNNVGRPPRYSCFAYCLIQHGVLTGVCKQIGVNSNACLSGAGVVPSAHCLC